jgi:glycosyltransferase involved in cell wall biosynthesis
MKLNNPMDKAITGNETDSDNPIQVAVTYRVCQHWRAHIFEKLNARADLELTVFHGKSVPQTKLENGKNLQGFNHIELWTMSYPGSGWVFQPFLGFRLILHSPDVILAEGGSNFFSNFLVLIYSKIFRRPIIWWTLGELPEGSEYKGLIRSSYRRLVILQEKLSDVYLGYSSVAMDYFRRMGFHAENCFVAVNCVDTNKVFKNIETRTNHVAELKRKYDLNGKQVILFVGALTKQKRLDRLIRAFEMMKDEVPNAILMIVGDGVIRDEVHQMTKEKGIDSRTIFTGSIVENVSDYFELGDIFVLPGLGGLAISEAMAHGLPVLCTFADGCEVDLVVDRKTGFRIMSDVDEEVDLFLYEKLVYILKDNNRLREMSYNARNRILNQHNVNTYIDGIVDSIKYAFKKSRRKK